MHSSLLQAEVHLPIVLALGSTSHDVKQILAAVVLKHPGVLQPTSRDVLRENHLIAIY